MYLRVAVFRAVRLNDGMWLCVCSCSQGLHSYFQENDFVQLHSPILTSNDCEGAGEMFRIAKIGMDVHACTEWRRQILLT